MDQEDLNAKKAHRERHSGRKAEKKKAKNKHVQEETAKQKNPKAFAFQSAVKAQRATARAEDLKSKKHHIPVVSRTPLEPAPVIVAIVGGRKVGKTTLLRSLIKKYTKQKLTNIKGPITVVTGKKQRLTFVEVNNDVNSLVDIAKIADVVLMLVDITIGIEMEVFEFLEICRAYGMPRIMGVLNHLDLMKENKGLRRRRKELVHRFQVELYPGAKLFYLSGIIHEEYPRMEVNNLARYISVLKYRPLHFRSTHSYVLVDRLEDLTDSEAVRRTPHCNRSVVLYGYVRGIPMRHGQSVHLPGVGDCRIKDISILGDPCPLPETIKKRSLNAKERLIYCPMSGVCGIVYDKDAIYVEVSDSAQRQNSQSEALDETREIMDSLLNVETTLGEKRGRTEIALFSHSQPIKSSEVRDMALPEISDQSDAESHGESSNEDDERSEPPRFEVVSGEDGIRRRRAVFPRFRDDDQSDSQTAHPSPLEADQELRPKKRSFKGFGGEGVSEDECDFTEVRPVSSDSLTVLGYCSYLNDAIYGNEVAMILPKVSRVEEADEPDHLFVKSTKSVRSAESARIASDFLADGVDSAKLVRSFVRDWSRPEVRESVRDCFVSGEWSAAESAEKLLAMDAEDHDLYGDFEDLETGRQFTAHPDHQNPEAEDAAAAASEDPAAAGAATRLEKKRRLKAMFDAEFDEKGKGDAFDALKAEMNEQAELNRTQFEGMDSETRVKLEGFRAGLYVRIEFAEMPCELVDRFDSSYPLVVGGLLDNELNMGYVRARIKNHRWYPRILKTGDPLYLSIGWRRFQTMMFYAKREDNFRLRSLKYARKYLHVETVFWGPVAETSSGFIAFQDINNKTADFSIAANGVVLESDKSTNLVKKLKLIGYPEKIFQKTAFIKDMFHSDTEITKFEGSRIQTQSSIRGVIKKAVGQNGVFRATFEDQIKMSDVIVLTTWASVDVPKFCNIVKNLLLPPDAKNEWNGMKTTAQVKRERNIRAEPAHDSLYKEIVERREHVRLPLKISKSLQAALPYHCKPKYKPAAKKKQRVLVVSDPEEVKMKRFMSQLRTLMEEKQLAAKAQTKKQRAEYRKKVAAREQMRRVREQKKKAHACKRKSSKSKSLA